MADDNVEEVGVRLIVDGRTAFSSDMKASAASVEELSAAVKAANDKLAATNVQLNKTGVETENTRKRTQLLSSALGDAKGAFTEAKTAAKDFVSPLQAVGGALENVASSRLFGYNAWGVLTAGIVGATAAVTVFGLKSYASFQSANASFQTLLGSSSAASAYMVQLKNFAATTPFDFQSVVPDAQKLINTGDTPDQSIKDLTALGNAASATGGGQDAFDHIALAYSQIKSSPTLHSQDLNQLVQAGINPYAILAGQAGVSEGKFRNDVAAGTVPGAQSASALITGIQAKYGNAMQLQSGTLTQQLSNLHDIAQQDFATAVTPLADLLQRNLPKITTDMTKLATVYGHGLQTTVNDFELLYGAYKRSGMSGAAGELDHLTGAGSTFQVLWSHISTDTTEMANVWEHSLYPAIRDVDGILGPFATGPLALIEDMLKWMNDHPKAARLVFDELFAALTIYKFAMLFNGITTALEGIILATAKVGVSMGVMSAETVAAAEESTGALTAFSTIARGEGAAGSVAPLGVAGLAAGSAYLGYKSATSKTLAGGVVTGAASGAGIGGTIGLLGGPFAEISVPVGAGVGGVIGGGLGALKYVLPGHATGGVVTSAGTSIVGEDGPEILKSKVGDTIIPLDKAAGTLGRTVVFESGAIQINGVDMDADLLSDTLVSTIQNKLARQ